MDASYRESPSAIGEAVKSERNVLAQTNNCVNVSENRKLQLHNNNVTRAVASNGITTPSIGGLPSRKGSSKIRGQFRPSRFGIVVPFKSLNVQLVCT